MIITRAPLGVSPFGGGADYRVWYKEKWSGGLSTAIDKYCYSACRRQMSADFVRGLWLTTEHGQPGEVYNLGGDDIYSVQEVIDARRSQLSVDFVLEQDSKLMRASDEPVMAGNTTKFHSCCGWKPEISLATNL